MMVILMLSAAFDYEGHGSLVGEVEETGTAAGPATVGST